MKLLSSPDAWPETRMGIFGFSFYPGKLQMRKINSKLHTESVPLYTLISVMPYTLNTLILVATYFSIPHKLC